MEMTKRNKIIISAVTVLVLLALYVALDRRGKEEVVPVDSGSTATSTTETIKEKLPSGVEYSIEPITGSAPTPVPDLDRVPVRSQYATSVTETDISNTLPKIKELQTFLKANPTVFAAWVDLGALQKNAGDYDGAILSWEYASKLEPKDFVALGNIGNLYGFYIKNVGMSDTYYRKAISRAPGESYLYAQLAEVYQYIGKNIGKTKAVLNEGLKAIPNDPNLTYLLMELDGRP